MIRLASKAKVIFRGSPGRAPKSARAMASYGICVGVLGAVRALGIPLIEVTGARDQNRSSPATSSLPSAEMIIRAEELYPEANFPRHAGKIPDKAEHLADAIASIHAGVRTPMFQNLLRLHSEGMSPCRSF